MSSINREYKDRLFRFIFGSEEMKDNIIQLYNALNDTDYHSSDEIEIATMSDAIYLKMKNELLLEKCKPLKDYMDLINRVRTFNKEYPLQKAVDLAVDLCISDGILSDFLVAHRAEVCNMILTEYDEKAVMEGFKEEGFEEGYDKGFDEGIERGIEQGSAEAQIKLLKNAMNNMGLTLEQALEALGIDNSEYESIKEKL